MYYTYLKVFAVKFKENAILTFLNNKAMVPVGEPLHAVSTNIRKHNRSLGIENVFTEALDHDWKVCRLAQTVVLVCDIPDSIKSSFMTGKPNITIKEIREIRPIPPCNWVSKHFSCELLY